VTGRPRAQQDGFLPVELLEDERFQDVEDRVLARLADEDLSRPDPEPAPIPSTAEEDAGEERRPWMLPERLRALPGGRRRAVAFAGAGSLLGMAAAAALWMVAPTAPDPSEAAATLPTQRFATGAAPAEAQLGDVDVGLGARTTLMAVGDDPRGWLVVLEQGRTRFVVPSRRRRPPFVVQAGAVRVEVVGTAFVVERDGREVDVTVAEGRVRVTGPTGARILEPGDRYTTRRRVPAEEDVAPAASEPEEGDGQPASGGAGPDHRRREPPSSPMARFEAASRLEATSPSAALAAYRRLAREPGPWGANALYAAGRLATEMGRADAARGLLRRYLARHPEGPNAPDARALLRALPSEAVD